MKKCPLRLQHQHSWKTAYAVFGFSRSLRDFRKLGLRQLFQWAAGAETYDRDRSRIPAGSSVPASV